MRSKPKKFNLIPFKYDKCKITKKLNQPLQLWLTVFIVPYKQISCKSSVWGGFRGLNAGKHIWKVIYQGQSICDHFNSYMRRQL